MHCEATVTRTRRDGGQHCDEASTPGFYQVTAARPVVSYVMPSQARPTDQSKGITGPVSQRVKPHLRGELRVSQ